MDNKNRDPQERPKAVVEHTSEDASDLKLVVKRARTVRTGLRGGPMIPGSCCGSWSLTSC